ncbi:MAG TPA: ABC-type transport auxiliary lipoprotein family protein [Burkholderiales bacterium]|nr:ABC-type transport auxiliary lipoprotein family protein [Burkholderiales bacterium]
MTRRARFLAVLALAGCALGAPPRPPQALYDFGSPAAGNSPHIAVTLAVSRVAAPEWLESPTLQYRLAYQDALRYRGYAGSRWVASPAQLLTERLRQAVAQVGGRGAGRGTDAVKTDYLLRVELEEFCQVFDSPQASRGVVRARAGLVREGRVLVAQKIFAVEKPAATADAAGGAEALAGAADQLVSELVAWTAQSTGGEGK